MRMFIRIKIWIIKNLLTENEKCMLNQALNLQRLEIHKDARNGHTCDYKQDLEEVQHWLTICENSLWS